VKLLLPVAGVLLAAGLCCCGGDFEKVLREAGIDPGSSVSSADGRSMFAVPADHQVRISDLSTEDAYYSDRSTIVGQICVTDGASTYNGDGWQGGSVKDCGNGSTYYFYKAAYVDLGAAPVTVAPPVSLVPAIPGLRATRSLAKGTRVKLLDIHSEDAYYSDRSTMLGKLCTLGEDSSFKDGEWHGGSTSCDDGSSYYFYKAAYEEQASAARPTPTVSATPSGVATYSVPSGTRVKIADIHSEDAYYSTRSEIIGKTCTLDEDSSFKDGKWHGGPAHCGGDSYYFYKAAYTVLGGGGGGTAAVAPAAAAPAALSGRRIKRAVREGRRFKIADIATDDAYYADRGGMIGKVCTAGELSTFREPQWHGGSVSCDDGSSYYFYKAAYAPLGADAD
jgi:hypothetical protein